MDSNVSLADIAAVTDRNDGFGFGSGGGAFWIFALLILPMLWGGNGPFGRNGGNPVTEAGLCEAMNSNNLQNAVGRLSDTVQAGQRQTDNAVCNLGYQALNIANQSQRDMCTGFTSVTGAINQARFENQNCCCETQKLIQQGQYQDAMNTASINANTAAQIQSVKDMLVAQENARKDARIWQLELNQAMCGVVRYPLQTTYATNCNPFFSGYNGGYGNNCGCNSGCC